MKNEVKKENEYNVNVKYGNRPLNECMENVIQKLILKAQLSKLNNSES